MDAEPRFRALPSVEEVLRCPTGEGAVARFGRQAAVGAARRSIAAARDAIRAGAAAAPSAADVGAAMVAQLADGAEPRIRAVYNLTGTVLHTNLGRAVLAEAAIEAATRAMREAVALEFDLDTGKRGERDNLVRDLLCELTGAEDATLVNNNAGALMIALNTLALDREAIVSRGEMIEIGGAFRLPDIMTRSGVRLREVGTTNRTHPRDYAGATNAETGLILKVHTSNYRVEGFTAEVSGRDLAPIAREAGVPLVNDLGSGTLVDLARWGLAHEPTVAEAVRDGADVVTFSGDKLLGGPQAGFIVGRRELIARINANPMKRALRVDKIRLAAIEATLWLYRDPDSLASHLPTLRQLARTEADIRAMAEAMLPAVAAAFAPTACTVEVASCASQIGSGALPLSTLASSALRIAPAKGRSGRVAEDVAAAFRALPVPVIGRIEGGAFWLDLRCLEKPEPFLDNLASLSIGGP